MMTASSITGMNSTANIFPLDPTPEIIEIKIEKGSIADPKKITIEKTVITVEEYVRNYFSDIPVMVEVAKCESRFRQHDAKGNVLRGEENKSDLGVMQINKYYHEVDSEKLGYDIVTIEGNTAYARHLFEKSGVKPWSSSSRCWMKSTAYLEYASLAIAK